MFQICIVMNLVSIKEYSRLCNITVPTVRNRIVSKKIKPVKRKILGRTYYLIDLDTTPVIPSRKKNVGRKPSKSV